MVAILSRSDWTAASGVQVVVGTPGRIMDHLRRGPPSLDAVRIVVLDEVEEMLRWGFRKM
ncbi:MAG: DEAD/DEAH box helicase, partial [Anaerolineales bacterium]|nr:DEAD/DEAH box helicase [Anaerolineales bacterium]